MLTPPPTTVSSLLKRAEAHGHLVRERNPDDGRSYLLRLTADGQRVHRRATQVFAPVLGRVVQELGRDEPSVRRALATLRRALGEASATEHSTHGR